MLWILTDWKQKGHKTNCIRVQSPFKTLILALYDIQNQFGCNLRKKVPWSEYWKVGEKCKKWQRSCWNRNLFFLQSHIGECRWELEITQSLENKPCLLLARAYWVSNIWKPDAYYIQELLFSSHRLDFGESWENRKSMYLLFPAEKFLFSDWLS